MTEDMSRDFRDRLSDFVGDFNVRALCDLLHLFRLYAHPRNLIGECG
jgi:hypothetical protein